MLLQECRSISDAELVVLVLGGETGLYEMLMRRYNQRLFRVIRSIVTNEAEAEDALQESWVRAYEHLDQFAGRSSFATWITRIAFHEALARARKSKRWVSLEGAGGEIITEVSGGRTESVTPEDQAMQNEMGHLLQTALDALPEIYRAVFVLREVEQLSTSETAECLDLSEEAVKTRLHRSRALLRRALASSIGPAYADTHIFLGERCNRTVARVLERISDQNPPPA